MFKQKVAKKASEGPVVPLALAAYKREYGLEMLGAAHFDLAGEKAQLEQSSDFPARCKKLAERYMFLCMLAALDATPIRLPMRRGIANIYGTERFKADFSKVIYGVQAGLYIGGLQQPISYLSYKPVPDGGWPPSFWLDAGSLYQDSVFTGPLPSWVGETAKIALHMYPFPDRFLVASREPKFFNATIILPSKSPLLVVIGLDGSQWLLAAWGLEHEYGNLAVPPGIG